MKISIERMPTRIGSLDVLDRHGWMMKILDSFLFPSGRG
jgi:hypothetical protein